MSSAWITGKGYVIEPTLLFKISWGSLARHDGHSIHELVSPFRQAPGQRSELLTEVALPEQAILERLYRYTGRGEVDYGYDAKGRLLKHYEARQGNSNAQFRYEALARRTRKTVTTRS